MKFVIREHICIVPIAWVFYVVLVTVHVMLLSRNVNCEMYIILYSYVALQQVYDEFVYTKEECMYFNLC